MWKKRTSKISPACCLSLAFPLDSPRSFWWYHLICWLLSAVGVVCILVAHEHYSVDVVVAYFITSRLFWWYHTMANLQVRTQRCPAGLRTVNMRSVPASFVFSKEADLDL